jgi:hypothetical protein
VSHAGMPEVSVILLKMQVWTVYFILTEIHAVSERSTCIRVNRLGGLLTQEPIEVILRSVVPIRGQTGRTRALAGEARVHLPPHIGVVVAIVVACQICAECKAASTG